VEPAFRSVLRERMTRSHSLGDVMGLKGAKSDGGGGQPIFKIDRCASMLLMPKTKRSRLSRFRCCVAHWLHRLAERIDDPEEQRAEVW